MYWEFAFVETLKVDAGVGVETRVGDVVVWARRDFLFIGFGLKRELQQLGVDSFGFHESLSGWKLPKIWFKNCQPAVSNCTWVIIEKLSFQSRFLWRIFSKKVEILLLQIFADSTANILFSTIHRSTHQSINLLYLPGCVSWSFYSVPRRSELFPLAVHATAHRSYLDGSLSRSAQAWMCLSRHERFGCPRWIGFADGSS